MPNQSLAHDEKLLRVWAAAGAAQFCWRNVVGRWAGLFASDRLRQDRAFRGFGPETCDCFSELPLWVATIVSLGRTLLSRRTFWGGHAEPGRKL